MPLLTASHLKKFYPVARGFFGKPGQQFSLIQKIRYLAVHF